MGTPKQLEGFAARLREWRGVIGACFSVLWVGGFLVSTFWNGLPDMKPNEWGDWAAGLAAPLAFLWLVVGYLQQGEELRANVDALKQQAVELKNSVSAAISASRAWVGISHVYPVSVALHSTGAHLTVSITIRNAGNTPAVRCEVWTAAVPSTNGGIQPGERAVKRCKEFADSQKDVPSGIILLPGGEETVDYGTGVEQQDITATTPTAGVDQLRYFHVAVLVYYTMSNGERGETSQLFS